MIIADQWKDYELIMTGDGQKLERWGEYVLKRPDPQAIWPPGREWPAAHGVYHRSAKGGGSWDFKEKLPGRWTVAYGDLRFHVEPTGFKHTGLFPEQAVNWDYMMKKISGEKRKPSILNLFAYTGGASVACASAGASVCHVDASKGMVADAKENLALSGLEDRPVRFIVDDCIKFVNREIRRNSRYAGIIMDPPAYGRGPSGELWKIEDKLYELIALCVSLLSDQPLFFLVNSYTGSVSPVLIENIFRMLLKGKGGSVTSHELGLKATGQDVVLPCGFTVRWEA
ncbi:MAG: class I SAM-dependent methyltransferase [Clostridia bacterium]